MKRIVIIFLILLAILPNLNAQEKTFKGNIKELFKIENNKIISVDYYSLYYDYDIDHNSNKYIVFGDSCSFTTSNYFYIVKALQLNDSEYYEDWGDSLFSKLEIKCFDFKGNMVRRHEFINDNQWSRFNYWSFAADTDNPWIGQGRELCKIIPLVPNCMAIVLRGFRDSVEPEELTIFVVFEDQVQLVYHKNIEINKMLDTATGVRYELMTVDYDEDGRMIPQYFHMDFGQGKITIE
jgi:hypothetical protein